MADKTRKVKKTKKVAKPPETTVSDPWWEDDQDIESWFEPKTAVEFDPDNHILPSPLIPGRQNERVNSIRRSYDLLKQFTAEELRVLLDLKRNTSTKAWTLREDLLVLTSTQSNSELAEMLNARNKEAIKKRLQLLKSKGLIRRHPEADEDVESSAEA